MWKMSTGLQPDHGSDHMLPTRDRASRRRQARGRLRGAPDVGREADWADRGSTLWGLKNGDARLGWQTVPGRVQLGTKEGAMGPTAAGFGTEAPSLFICMMVRLILRGFAPPQTWS